MPTAPQNEPISDAAATPEEKLPDVSGWVETLMELERTQTVAKKTPPIEHALLAATPLAVATTMEHPEYPAESEEACLFELARGLQALFAGETLDPHAVEQHLIATKVNYSIRGAAWHSERREAIEYCILHAHEAVTDKDAREVVAEILAMLAHHITLPEHDISDGAQQHSEAQFLTVLTTTLNAFLAMSEEQLSLASTEIAAILQSALLRVGAYESWGRGYLTTLKKVHARADFSEPKDIAKELRLLLDEIEVKIASLQGQYERRSRGVPSHGDMRGGTPYATAAITGEGQYPLGTEQYFVAGLMRDIGDLLVQKENWDEREFRENAASLLRVAAGVLQQNAGWGSGYGKLLGVTQNLLPRLGSETQTRALQDLLKQLENELAMFEKWPSRE